MIINVPAGSPPSASKEAENFKTKINQANLASVVVNLIFDAKINEFSVIFHDDVSEKQKSLVYHILVNTVTAWEIDGVFDNRGPDEEVKNERDDIDEDDEAEKVCPACRGTRLDEEGNVCLDCN